MAKATKVVDTPIEETQTEVVIPSPAQPQSTGMVTVIGLGRKHRYKEGKEYQVSQSVAAIIIEKQFVKLKK